MKRFAFLISFICFLAFSSSTFSQFVFADDKKVIKKKLRKKVSIEKADGKITIKKKINIKKTVKKRKDDDKGGVPKQIRKLNAKVNALQQQVDTIELTPGPPGTPGADGEDGAPGPKGNTGEQGLKGDTGQQGIPGEKGDTGAKGETGEQGLKGDKGDTGATGATGAKGDTGDTGAKGDTGEAGPSGAEIAGRLDPCGPNGGLGIIAHIPGRSFSVRLPFDGSFIFSHIPEGTHTIAFELNGSVIGMLPNVTAVEGQVTDVGVFVTPYCSSDLDGDGVTGSQGDCDNNNASVFPGATEVCDGVDNNCDTVVDEGGVCTSPVDCQVSSFGAFSACSQACGGGTATRTRTIVVQPANGGAACPALTEDVACNTQECPTQCAPGQTDCNGQCADTNTDTNNCGGCNVACGSGEICNNGSCDASQCQVSNWSAFSACSQACGGGMRTRTRSVVVNGPNCPSLIETEVCNTQPCAVDCEMSAWGDYSDCSQVCGGGTQTRTRSITQAPQFGGAACGSTMEVRECNTQPCAVNCEMSAWSEYSACSVACGGGTQTRNRSIIQEPQNGGAACGSTIEDRACNTDPCDTVNGDPA
jgi:hypothetical protein